jgi:hypothetical protein
MVKTKKINPRPCQTRRYYRLERDKNNKYKIKYGSTVTGKNGDIMFLKYFYKSSIATFVLLYG